MGQGLGIALAGPGAGDGVNYKSYTARAESTCRTIMQAGGEAEAFQADIGSKVAFEQLVERVCARFGRIDVLVNNAARTRFGHIFDLTEDDFDDVINTNLRGPFFGSVAAARTMVAQGGCSIIII